MTGAKRRPHLGAKVIRGLRKLTEMQAKPHTELAAALDYCRALARWHGEHEPTDGEK
jgi:hypothetical protein